MYDEIGLSKVISRNETILAGKGSFLIVKQFCVRQLFSYESYVKAVRKYLHLKSRIPVYISSKLLLIPIKSPKRSDNVWVNFFSIQSVTGILTKTYVLFDNLVELELDINLKSFNKSIEACIKIISYLEEAKDFCVEET